MKPLITQIIIAAFCLIMLVLLAIAVNRKAKKLDEQDKHEIHQDDIPDYDEYYANKY